MVITREIIILKGGNHAGEEKSRSSGGQFLEKDGKVLEKVRKQKDYQVQDIVDALIETAKQKGGYDNVTVVIAEVVEGDENVNISR